MITLFCPFLPHLFGRLWFHCNQGVLLKMVGKIFSLFPPFTWIDEQSCNLLIFFRGKLFFWLRSHDALSCFFLVFFGGNLLRRYLLWFSLVSSFMPPIIPAVRGPVLSGTPSRDEREWGETVGSCVLGSTWGIWPGQALEDPNGLEGNVMWRHTESPFPVAVRWGSADASGEWLSDGRHTARAGSANLDMVDHGSRNKWVMLC